ncbi:6-hydroxycyclohex-1-ene-1-carbonyl-CoA dehydrogenase [Bradyrhizobium sp. USDA 4369]
MSLSEYQAWRMVQSDRGAASPYTFERFASPLPEIKSGEALVEISACSICGTDLSYFFGDVPTVVPPPVTLGHEASGRVLRGGGIEGKAVILPTIVPCRKCELCRTGRANRCLNQKMYGGNHGPWGGFASHIVAPISELTLVPDDCQVPLERLAVVADAISTPYQAIRRARVEPGTKVVVIGATGGLGVYLLQLARLLGAATVIGIARDAAKLDALRPYGLDAAIVNDGRPVSDLRHEIWKACKTSGINPRCSWIIFEATGTVAGQELGLSLLTFASRLVLVGYAPGAVNYQLSRVMALDAEIIGSWGADPRLYADVLQYVINGQLAVVPFTETRPMRRIAESFSELRAGRKDGRRIVLTADWTQDS